MRKRWGTRSHKGEHTPNGLQTKICSIMVYIPAEDVSLWGPQAFGISGERAPLSSLKEWHAASGWVSSIYGCHWGRPPVCASAQKCGANMRLNFLSAAHACHVLCRPSEQASSTDTTMGVTMQRARSP
jgi:hypothetical protein